MKTLKHKGILAEYLSSTQTPQVREKVNTGTMIGSPRIKEILQILIVNGL